MNPNLPFKIRRDGARYPTLATFDYFETALAHAADASVGQGGARWHVVQGRYEGVILATVTRRAGKDAKVVLA